MNATTPDDGTYEIDTSSSTVRFRTKHLFGLGNVDGTFDISSGHIVVSGSQDASRRVEISVIIDAKSFESGSAARDKKVLSATFLDAEKHPEITFAAQGALPDGAGSMRGEVTAVSTTHSVDLQVEEVRPKDEGFEVRATAPINRYDFGVTKMKGMSGRDLAMTLDVVARRA